MGAGYAGYASVFSRKTAQVGPLTIRYLEGGHGEPLLYLHGLEGWGLWDSFHIAFGVTNRVMAPLLPGWQDGRIPPSIKSPRDYAKIIYEFAGAIGIKKLTLVGHSVGGWVALCAAAEYPDLVERLVLIDSLGLHAAHTAELAIRNMDQEAFSHAVFARHEKVLVPHSFNPDFGGEFQELKDSPEFKRYWRNREVLVKWLGDRLEDPGLLESARHIKAKTLIVWGREDGLVPCEDGRLLAEAIANSRLAVIKDAAHSPMKDKRETFQRVVYEFLSAPDNAVQPKLIEL
jgi:4,5:9,10-diseco-3-hydroxy-5,9,17-trioxoandrosta-1(10),2-diene-4-oate hydrolase